ncbi:MULTISPECIES: aminoacyl-tRNA hydrolase [Chryseobacterium]|uniref:Peptidyl-tRNA hydrolase n=1 Tax=Chryseobacterium camelliae TaxID=1265445 RepID=A0ABU0TNW1_9FLAO|nr:MULTISPECIES: aminoacyl-tRNA hydrolase [Chryseobacterium]MDT3407640.1 PTH1 family peptidyl-tRNA hydrolase [Pseudacidovorax intermedius]MDQ1098506.1 PTH1 family peptidyl-tRNA hydrolase [Chryseobacterium camelliae]MDQ1102431.1 PTH1 family peptidyl-tRNA hydrolase [Chryseobacterium sp. SORGH_AS_1048]MDR6085865.1 PTH1 family peptidyl-tRNA hydrolase [Chryseobacterium sp. SORGH_AS_0909]MDR6130231.1 PTH1 family peptidyl-tRNA hydrolase [Chryseobacterium sp. SORGH_AS_1175]
MKYLIVGLGNKGAEYENTRHNIGFKVADKIAETLDVSFNTTNFGWMADGKYKGRRVLVLKPDTYMNLSGNAVKYWMQKENIPLDHVLIITDDLALPFGTLRMKAKGSDAGHNGLKNINEVLQTQNYARLRFGISADFSEGRQIDYVLGTWNEEESGKLQERIEKFAQASLSFVFAGINNTMSAFNGK